MSITERADCYLCEDGDGEYRAAVETPDDVHHAVNTLICWQCVRDDRVIRVAVE